MFFFLVGLELKREFITGDLRDPQTALVPVVAAVGGVAVPALIFVLCTLGDPAARTGWAIPAATDIAFALAVLAVIGSHLPAALRTFLLTLAVADDLIAITIIAFFYTRDLQPVLLLAALVPIALFAVVAYRCQRFISRHAWAPWLLLVPLAAVAWALTYASGVHATVAGVLLALCRAGAHGSGQTMRPTASPRSSSTASGRSPPGWPCPCSRSSPQGWPSAAGTASPRPSLARSGSASSSGSSRARRSASPARPGWSPGCGAHTWTPT